MLSALLAGFWPPASAAQSIPLDPQSLNSDGWAGFTDIPFLANALLSLLLATLLGATIAFHPRSRRTIDSIEETEAPKVYVVYAVVGAIIGLMVLKYGHGMGFVIFGIGGLLRFRTLVRSAHETGRVIFVTLIGLSCGLDLPHVAVLTTVFGFVLIQVLDARITYRVVVKGLHKERVTEAAEHYRRVLEAKGCRVLNEKKRFGKPQVAFIFRAPRHVRQQELEQSFDREIPEELRGALDWEIE